MIDLSELKNRDGLGEWLNQRGLLGVGLEVGSLYGEFAGRVISTWKGKQLILLDPWCKQPSDIYREPVNDCNWNDAYRSCQLLQEKDSRITLMRDYSPGAAAYFRDDSLDWVYIDGRHDHDAISSDLRAWWPKVKSGGLFSGHDYRNEHNETQCCDVKRAVDEWNEEFQGPGPYVTKWPGCYSWWFLKP